MYVDKWECERIVLHFKQTISGGISGGPYVNINESVRHCRDAESSRKKSIVDAISF